MANSPDIGETLGRYCELSTRQVPAGERWWLWRDVGLHSYEPEFAAAGECRPFAAQMSGFITATAELRNVQCDPLVVRRTPAQCRQDGNDRILLSAMIGLDRPTIFDNSEGDGLVATGQIVVSDMARPFNVVAGRYHAVNLRLDRSSVANAIGGDPARLHGVVLRQTPLVSLLFGQMQALAAAIPVMTGAARYVGLDALVDFALGTLRLEGRPDAWEEGTHWSSLWRAACQYIDRNLGNTELSPEMLANALRCSRTQLYRAFARHDRTVMGHVLERRLARSQEMLADPACQQSIAAIGWMCGFEDQSTFSRSFRRRFGCQPRDVRRQARSIDLCRSAAEHRSPATRGN